MQVNLSVTGASCGLPALDPELATPPPTCNVLGVDVTEADYARTIDWIDATIQENGRAYVCVAATHTVVSTQDDPDLKDAVCGAALVVPDGQPVVWAMNAFGAKLDGRVYGPTLMERHIKRSAQTGVRHFLYGGRDESALTTLQANLSHSAPGVALVGGYCPPFRVLAEDELDRIATTINAARPDVVWVGIGVPKQEKWMAAMRDRLDAPVLIGVGAAFDFHAGIVPQAPAWMQTRGLEWLFRLVQEPRRLWRRYLTYNPRFVFGVLRQYGRRRRGRSGR